MTYAEVKFLEFVNSEWIYTIYVEDDNYMGWKLWPSIKAMVAVKFSFYLALVEIVRLLAISEDEYL